MSEKMIEMSGCSKIEIQIARMFWKSFTLQPPIESKLYSPDIKQRRRTADAGGKRIKGEIIYLLRLQVDERMSMNRCRRRHTCTTIKSISTQMKRKNDEVRKDLHQLKFLLEKGMIYHKRMQTLKLQRNLREIRQKKEEVSKRK